MYPSEPYRAGAQKRMAKARGMMPPNYVLIRDLAEENFIRPNQILRWIRKGYAERIICNGFAAIIPNDKIVELIDELVRQRNKPVMSDEEKENKYIDKDGCIFNWAGWLRAVKSPTYYTVDYNSISH